MQRMTSSVIVTYGYPVGYNLTDSSLVISWFPPPLRSWFHFTHTLYYTHTFPHTIHFSLTLLRIILHVTPQQYKTRSSIVSPRVLTQAC